MKRIARVAALAAALVLSACTSIPRTQTLPALAARPAAFEMSGRLSIREGQRSEIARLRWSRRADGDTWVIASPLGNEVARIEAAASGATLTQAGAAAQSAPSFAALTGAVLGIPLDPDELAAWLHGTPASNVGGWMVELEETQAAGAVSLARRITARRGDITVRLVVDDYRAGGAP